MMIPGLNQGITRSLDTNQIGVWIPKDFSGVGDGYLLTAHANQTRDVTVSHSVQWRIKCSKLEGTRNHFSLAIKQ